MVVVSAQQIDDRMRIGAGRQSCNEGNKAYQLLFTRATVRCAIRSARISVGPSAPTRAGSSIRIARISVLCIWCTRMHLPHLPSTAHRRASAQARRPPRTICICGCVTGARPKEMNGSGDRSDGNSRKLSLMSTWNTMYQDIEPARLQTMTMKRRRCW